MLARSKTLALGSMLMTALWLTPALALEEDEKKEMGQFIREYLLENPEVMLEVQAALEAKQQSQRLEQAGQAVAANHDAIFNSEDDIALGNPDGDVTVVEFFDYNCGYCKRAMADMEKVLATDPKVRFVLKELPILGADSLDAHRVSNAVRLIAPEKYGEFHRALLGSTGTATEESAIKVAAALGISEADIRKSMAENPNDQLVRDAYTLATNLGVTGTPTYIVGNEALFGAVGDDALQEKIANVRACGKSTC
ncbi:Outer membrane protein [Pseudorhizobium banfieldiae]|uniref:Outer membrane protein n=1 Tax=Pseudorhizobium banfieldiae TaxID=1125847 RepID=L0ND60_9HYPH|nr:disulfide bond formation protein DsbA [arsenite-oxidising bacterium NT-25]CCF19053.1 Outer membrane protein [Pseudorhizobium banfieldiae]